MSVNRVFLLGNLGRDPEVRYTQGGTTVANLRIATTERRPDGNGGWQDATEWHSVVVFGKQADNVKKFLTKGRQVFVEGSLRTRQWQDQQGQKRFSTEVVARDVRFIGGRPSGGAGGAGGGFDRPDDMAAPVGADDNLAEFGGGGTDDDIPF
ncbi:MAG TPA: single-stranded DNA-binding protein [Candidatus Acidoferrales bacterium]|nr:single-stranded DNA-binding protein [Candidatus Acidoferrales bacterium]